MGSAASRDGNDIRNSNHPNPNMPSTASMDLAARLDTAATLRTMAADTGFVIEQDMDTSEYIRIEEHTETAVDQYSRSLTIATANANMVANRGRLEAARRAKKWTKVRPAETALSMMCCRTPKDKSSYWVILVVELVICTVLMIFTMTNLLSGPEVAYLLKWSKFFEFWYLWVMLGVEMLWWVTVFLSTFGIHKNVPYFILPYVFTSLIVMLGSSFALTRSVFEISEISATNMVSSTIFIVPIISFFLFIINIWFFYLKCLIVKFLIRKRKVIAVTATCIKNHNTYNSKASPNEVKAKEIEEDTFSTQSTVIMSDDYLKQPPMR